MLNNRKRGKALNNKSGSSSQALNEGKTTLKDVLSFRSTAMGLAGLLSLLMVIQWSLSATAVVSPMGSVTDQVGTVAIDLLATLPELADYQAVSNVMTQIPVTKGSSERNAHPLNDCSPTAQVRLLMLTQETVTTDDTSGSSTLMMRHHEWVLQSLDVQGKEKKVGGDEYYVTWYDGDDESKGGTLMAVVEDLKHGWYRLDFVTSPMQPSASSSFNVTNEKTLLTNMDKTGRLNVDLVYTCGIGHIAPPAKDEYKSGSPTRVLFTQQKVPQPPHRVFSPPKNIDLRPYHQAIFFGDANMKQMVRTVSSKTRTGVSPFFRPEVEYKHNPQMALDSTTVQDLLEKLEEWHGNDLRRDGSGGNTALVVGSSVWDLIMTEKNSVVQGPEFEDHLEAARLLVTTIRERYPNCYLVWKSPTALLLHRVQPKCLALDTCRNRTRYMSESRSRLLYTKQKQLMEELQVPFMDLYEASYLAADYIKWSDGQHFVARLNRVMLAWMYQDDVSLRSRDFYTQAIVDDDAVSTFDETGGTTTSGETPETLTLGAQSSTTTTSMTLMGGW